MDKTEKLREEIRKRDDLLPKLIELWKNNASVDETMKLIKDAGFDVTYEDVEKLLALVQKIHADGIALEKIDMDELSKVTGGWCFLGMHSQGYGESCKYQFKEERFQNLEDCWLTDTGICASTFYCDESSEYIKCDWNYSPYKNYDGKMHGSCMQTWETYRW